MDKVKVFDLIVQYGAYTAEAAGYSEKAASATTLAEQDMWNKRAKTAFATATWTYTQIEREMSLK